MGTVIDGNLHFITLLSHGASVEFAEGGLQKRLKLGC